MSEWMNEWMYDDFVAFDGRSISRKSSVNSNISSKIDAN